jgi:hypothetical protein
MKKLIGFAFALLALLSPSVAQRTFHPGVRWIGKPAVKAKVAWLMAHKRLNPDGGHGSPLTRKPYHRLLNKFRQVSPNSPSISSWPWQIPMDARTPQRRAPQSLGHSWLGGDSTGLNFVPPDPMGAAGPTQFLMCVNGIIRLFSKAGQLGAVDMSTDDFFFPVLNGDSTSDPRVRFDPLSQRWFVTIITTQATPNSILIAVSDSATITDATSFSFFSFVQDEVGKTPNSDTGGFCDYDTLGIDSQALYIGGNIFDSTGTSFIGTSGFVVNKKSLLEGGPIVATAFRQLASSGSDGPVTPQGVDHLEPGAGDGYFIGPSAFSFGLLMLRQVSDPGGSPAISDSIPVTVASTAFPIFAPALGSHAPLDSLDDRLINAQIKTAPGGAPTLWTAHTIGVNSTGVADLNAADRDAIRWYQIGDLAGNPSLLQSGTIFDASPAALSFYIPSIAMSGQGHVAVGSNVSGETERADVQVSGRYADDPLGRMQPYTLVQKSPADYNAEAGAPVQRWGDYSFTCVDPADNMTLWTVQEYCDKPDTWALRIIELKAPPPPAVTISPANLLPGDTRVLDATGDITSGAGFYSPGAGYPRALGAQVSGTGLKVLAVSYVGPSHVQVKVAVATDAAPGPRTLTMTNPDGQQTSTPIEVQDAHLRIVPDPVYGGQHSQGTLIFDAPLTSSQTVQLSSTNAAVKLPASVQAPAGATKASFDITTAGVDATITSSITASSSNITHSAPIQVLKAKLRLLNLPAHFVGGLPVKGVLSSFGLAGPSGLNAVLTSSDPNVLTPPASVRINPGTSDSEFSMDSRGVNSNVTIHISASAEGVTVGADTVLTPADAVIGLSFTKSEIAGGDPVKGTARLNGGAPAGGVFVTLSSSNAALFSVPPRVKVAAASVEGSFIASSAGVTAPTAVKVTASFNGTSTSTTLTLLPASLLGIRLAANHLQGGSDDTVSVFLDGKAAGPGTVVTLSTSNPSVVHLPQSLTVSAGSSQASSLFAVESVARAMNVYIGATQSGVTKVTVLTVTPPTIASAIATPDTIKGPGGGTLTIRLTGKAPQGGAQIAITTSTPSALTIASTATVPAGGTSVTIPFTAHAVASNTLVVLNSTYNGHRGVTVVVTP